MLLRRLEQSLDEVLVTEGQLAEAIMKVREERSLSRVVGQQAVLALGRARLSAIEARGHVVTGHRSLERIAPMLGIDPVQYGDGDKTDPDVVKSAIADVAVAA